MDKRQELTEEQKRQILEAAYARYLKQLEAEKKARAAEAAAHEAAVKAEAEVQPETAVKAEKIVVAKPEAAAKVEIEKTAVARPEKKSKAKKKAAAGKAVKLPSAVKQKKQPLIVRMIDAYDRVMERVDLAFIHAYKSLADELFKAVRRYRDSRRAMAAEFLGTILICCGLFLVFNRFTVYEYAYNGRILGYVKDQTAVTDVLGVAGEHLSSNNNVNVKFVPNENVTFNLVSAADKSVDTSDEAVNKLAFMTDVEITACGIYEDGRLKAITESESAAKIAVTTAINHLSEPDKGMEVISSNTTKAITFETLDVMLTSVLSETQAAKALYKGGEQKIYHIVQNGETVSALCNRYAVKAENLFDETDTRSISSIEPGDKVCIHKTIECLEVKLVERGTMVEIIPFETIEKPSDQVYKGDTQIQQEGVEGRQKITGTVTKVGGKITKRKLTNTEEIVKKVDKIVLIGTADRPKEAPTGTYKLPITSYVMISDRFGPRWGKIHEGVDFAASTGTVILAADGGTIIEAGWADSYGYRLIIDHGSGNTTWYCHCNELYYGVGTKVYQGQPIAEVGSTGFSTGPHLHFELRQNGTAIDAGPILGVY